MMTGRPFELLDHLISIPSFSRQEDATAAMIHEFLLAEGVKAERWLNNVWAVADSFDPSKPTLLLNSHHDTVKPAAGYTRHPFTAVHEEGRIYGLGSNDAGASVVSLIETFLQLRGEKRNVNLVLGITAEEEVCGKNGMESLLGHFREEKLNIDMAIVGEPTLLQAAVAERGLVVLDCVATGKSGHAARNEGVNALYMAIDDINTLRNFKFDKVSAVFGDIKMTATMISAGTQHNVVPGRCEFVVDVRTTDAYSNEEVVKEISRALKSDVAPRSLRMQASAIGADHPLVMHAVELGADTYISPTLSDRTVMHGIPALKLGPGNSARSHTADEFVFEREIGEAIDFYKKLILSL